MHSLVKPVDHVGERVDAEANSSSALGPIGTRLLGKQPDTRQPAWWSKKAGPARGAEEREREPCVFC
jgi:hypothetical protein